METLLELDIARYQTAANDLEVKLEEYIALDKKISSVEKLHSYVSKNSGLSTITICKENFNAIGLEYDLSKIPLVNVEDFLESAKSVAKTLWEKIKELIQYIGNFIKSIYAKILGMVGRYDSRLLALQKNFNNILNKGEIELPNELWKSIFNNYPLLAKEKVSVYPVECINSHMLNILNTIIKPFGSIGDLGSGIFKIVDAIEANKDIGGSNAPGGLGSAIKSAENDSKLHFVLLTSIVKNELKFIGKDNDGKLQYSKYSIESKEYNLPEKCVIKKLDIDTIIQKLQNDYIKNLKAFKQAMDRFKGDLENRTKELLKDESKKEKIINLIKVSRALPIDCTISLYKNLSLTIGILESIYSRCSGDKKNVIGNYTTLTEILKAKYPDVALKFLNGNKETPYIYSRKLMDSIANSISLIGGFVILSSSNLSSIPEFKDINVPKDIDVESIIFLDEGFVSGKDGMDVGGRKRKLGKNLLEFCYYHEMGHAMLQQQETRQAELYKEFVGDINAINTEYKDVIEFLNKCQTYEDLIKKLKSDSKFEAKYKSYCEKSSSRATNLYLSNYTELQADCHAMLKLGMSIDALAKIRCDFLMPQLRPYIVQYKENIRKQIPYVKSMAKISTISEIKNFIKGNR